MQLLPSRVQLLPSCVQLLPSRIGLIAATARRVFHEMSGMGVMPFCTGLNVIVSRSGFETDTSGCVVVPSIGAALEASNRGVSDAPIHVLGGEDVYRTLLPHATMLRMTQIHQDYAGNVSFPEYRHSIASDGGKGIGEWKEVSREDVKTVDQMSNAPIELSFVDYKRV